MKCTNCGSELPEGAKFCKRCGAAVPVITARYAAEKPRRSLMPVIIALSLGAAVLLGAIIAVLTFGGNKNGSGSSGKGNDAVVEKYETPSKESGDIGFVPMDPAQPGDHEEETPAQQGGQSPVQESEPASQEGEQPGEQEGNEEADEYGGIPEEYRRLFLQKKAAGHNKRKISVGEAFHPGDTDSKLITVELYSSNPNVLKYDESQGGFIGIAPGTAFVLVVRLSNYDHSISSCSVWEIEVRN